MPNNFMVTNGNMLYKRTSVFISYAREDSNFVSLLRKSLESYEIDTKGDWLLTTGDSYQKRLREFNLSAHAFVFIISPDSIKSEACRNELSLAVENRKQILPISRRDHGEDNLLDSALRVPQWTFLRDGDNYEDGIHELVKALKTDFGLMEIHGQLLINADNWKTNNQNQSYLLRKDGLKEAEEWLKKTSLQTDKIPQPTPLQLEYIFASQRARSRGTRLALGLSLVITLILGLLSLLAWNNAKIANKQQQIAIKNANEAKLQKDMALTYAKKADSNAQEAKKQQKIAIDNAREAERQKASAIENADRAMRNQKEAELQKNKAITQLKRSDALRFATLSNQYLPKDPTLALKYANLAYNETQKPLVEAEIAMFNASNEITQNNYNIYYKQLNGEYPAYAVAVSPDNHTLAAGYSNGSITEWDLASGKKKKSFLKHQNFIQSLRYFKMERSSSVPVKLLSAFQI